MLYFTALTAGDWRWNCDQRRTDSNVHLRTAAWYRQRLRRGFREIGAGFWLRRGAPLTVWELESMPGAWAQPLDQATRSFPLQLRGPVAAVATRKVRWESS